MKRNKQSPIKSPIEYQLLLSQKSDIRNNKQILCLTLRTVEEFRNFRYEISVNDKIENDIILLTILGLHPPKILLPGGGPATFYKELPTPRGNCRISISKYESKENTFQINISRDAITIIKSPKERFVDLIIDQETE